MGIRMYYVGYGHAGAGKLHTYFGSDNFRTNQQVVVPIFNKKARKEYDTMGIIRGTYDANSAVAQKEINRFKQGGDLYRRSNLKMIKGTDVLELREDKEQKFASKAEWTRDWQSRQSEARAKLLSKRQSADNSAARAQLLGA